MSHQPATIVSVMFRIMKRSGSLGACSGSAITGYSCYRQPFQFHDA